MTRLLICGLLALSTQLSLAGEWERLEGCRLIPNEYNDGDSFHAEHEGKEYIFRLYFVDAPETEDDFPERVEEQAEHFGTTTSRVMEVGRYARAVTAQTLSEGFDVYTRWQPAGGRSDLTRHYAFVFAEGQDPKVPADLNAILVANGLARVHGTKAKPPDADLTAAELEVIYERLESEARNERAGAWGSGDEIKLAPYNDEVSETQPR